MGRLLNLTVLSFLFLTPFFCLGQSLGNSQVLDNSDREKLYLHFDKKDYVLGDTLWYKSYLVDAATNIPSQQSGIIYVEFIDSENILVKRFAHHTILGTSIGFIPTDTTYLSPGVYKVRAYSNWMRNFGDSLFFEQEFRLADHQFVDKWFLRIQQPQVLGDSMAMGLHFTDDRGRPLRNKAADFYLLGEKNRVAIHDRLQLDNEGSINVNFNIPEKFREGPLYLKITDVGNKKSVRVNAPFDISGRKRHVQFLPESGHLLVGMENRVGFKALGSNGLGSDVEGVVKDDTGKEVAAFRSVYKGMGSFVFTPEPGKVYIAHLSDGKEVALPKADTSGTILQLISERQNPFNVLDGNGSVTEQDNFVDSLINQDSVHLRFMVTADLIGKKYLLMGRSRGQNLYQKEIEMINQVVEIKIGKDLFTSGVSSLILSDKNGLVLNERSVFIDHQDGLDIRIEPSKEQYGLRDSVSLKINAKDYLGNPVMGTFSLAVTDTRQVDKDPVSDGNIRSYLLLQSDLKGKIEGAGYYFNKDSTGKAMDALLLTQGFVCYDWNPKGFAHKVEQEFTVSGQVVKGLKGTAPIAGTEVILASTRKNSMILNAMTDSNGHFLFQNIPSFDTVKFMVMSKNFKGKSFNVSVKVEKKDFASFEDLGFGNDYSDQVFIDRSLSVAPMRNTIRYIRPFSEVGLLNTVVITGKKKIPGSKNLNGSGNADIIFEEEDIKKMPDMNIYEFLKMNIKGYISPWGTEEQRMNDGDAGESRAFGKVGNSPVIISIDGEDVALFSRFYGSANLDLLRSDNIKGVEVMFKPKNSYRYDVRNSSSDSSSGGPSYLRDTKSNFPYHIEVTTKSGIGVRAFVESKTPGVEIYQPPIFYYGKEFYSPRYHTVDEKAEPLPDLRSTVYWNPRVITDEKGEATVSFYSADIPTNYLIMMEGMNLQGSIGAANSQVEIRE